MTRKVQIAEIPSSLKIPAFVSTTWSRLFLLLHMPLNPPYGEVALPNTLPVIVSGLTSLGRCCNVTSFICASFESLSFSPKMLRKLNCACGFTKPASMMPRPVSVSPHIIESDPPPKLRVLFFPPVGKASEHS
eukprot:TRINITY_DN4118_c0_g1_i5.p1 TRINITY_DN4118_c0_g1~~TRINITY_DN4118_c0_g1_i5.p1  ORF type:complete len:133 (-),score=20.77 TRINITY_DN4118_c0_g1_i5:1176-1574(-)